MTDPLILWKPIVEILIIWFLIYQIIRFFEGTRAVNVFRGIIVILAVFFLFQIFNFVVLDWIFNKIFGISVIALIIIFHPEIRQGLAKIGRRHIMGPFVKDGQELERILEQIGAACENLAQDKVGALIAIEKNDPLTSYIETGVIIDGKVTNDLIENIFTPRSMLHDGGLIIQQGRISAASCIFPLTEKMDLSRIFGMRHRAAIGISEVTDAVVIVVSEERQDISVFYHGKMYTDLKKGQLIMKIKDLLEKK